MPESEDESISESEEEYSSEESSGSAYSSSSVSGESDVSDSLKERRDSHGRASVSAKQLRNMVTNKAVLQEGELVDSRAPSKLPRKPMVELKACSNVWYQGQIIKESANEVKISYTVPSAQGSKKREEWLRKGSARIWRGSYKTHDWRHLGHGAWEPRARRRPKGARNKRGGAGGGAGGGGGGGGRNRKQQQQQQKHRSRKGSLGDSDSDVADGGETSGERPKSRSNHRGYTASQQRQQSSREGPIGGGKDMPPAGGGSVGKGADRAPGAAEGFRTGGKGEMDRGRGGRQSGHASPSHPPLTGRMAEDEVMSPRPTVPMRPGGGGGGGGEVIGGDGLGDEGGGGGGTGKSGARGGGIDGGYGKMHRSHLKGGPGATMVAVVGGTTDLGMAGTGLPEVLPPPQSGLPPRQPRHQHPQAQQQQDVGEVDEQASEHSPDDVAESPGGFLCDQASTRCSPSDEDAADGRGTTGAGGPAADPTYDPLARWFVAHYSQLQAAGMLGLLPGGMYECGRLPASFIVDPVTALIVLDGVVVRGGAPAAAAAAITAAASAQQPLGSTPAAAGFPQAFGGNGSAGHNMAPSTHMPVGRSAAASPVPCAGGAVATGSSAPPESMPQTQRVILGSGHRRSGDGGGGLPGPTRGGGSGGTAGAAAGGGPAAGTQRHLIKQTSGGSSNGHREREQRDGASVSPAGGLPTAGVLGKRSAAAGETNPASQEAAAGGGGGGGAGHGTSGHGSHPLKKFKRAVIISESEDDEMDPPLPASQAQHQQQLGVAALQAGAGADATAGPLPGLGVMGRTAVGGMVAGSGTGAGVSAAAVTTTPAAAAAAYGTPRPSAAGNVSSSYMATGGRQDAAASRGSGAPPNNGGSTGRLGAAGVEGSGSAAPGGGASGVTASVRHAGAGASVSTVAASAAADGIPAAAAVAAAPAVLPPSAAVGSGRGGFAGGFSNVGTGHRGGNGSSGAGSLRNGGSAGGGQAGGGGGGLAKDGVVNLARKDFGSSAPRPRAITTMDHDL